MYNGSLNPIPGQILLTHCPRCMQSIGHVIVNATLGGVISTHHLLKNQTDISFNVLYCKKNLPGGFPTDKNKKRKLWPTFYNLAVDLWLL